jgi:hypothetical protein
VEWERLEPGHGVVVPRGSCRSLVCRSAGMTGHRAHSPCRVPECLNRRENWHGSQHLIPCRGCGWCMTDAAPAAPGRRE